MIATTIARAVRGDSDALASLYLFLRERLLPFLERRRSRQFDPEDILTETMLRLWQNLRGLRDPARFLPYAFKTARAVQLDELRRRERQAAAFARYAERRVITCVPTGNLEADELLEKLHAALKPKECQLFNWLYVEGKADTEIEAELGVTNLTFRLRSFRLRRKLRLVVLRWQQAGRQPA